MNDRPEDLILMYLRRIDERTARIEDDIRDISRRLAAMVASMDRLTSDNCDPGDERSSAETLH